MPRRPLFGALALLASTVLAPLPGHAAEAPFLESELVFPLEALHNHASCIVETPRGDLLVCWFRGTGERTADDVQIYGARRRAGERAWSAPFVLADTPAFPDGNPCLFVDPAGRLWLFHTTILANTWESALLKYRISRDYDADGPPRWEISEVLHPKPGPEFEVEVERRLPEIERQVGLLGLTGETRREAEEFLSAMRSRATDKLYRRLGWMPRARPLLLDGQRLILPLYHDGFSFSLMAITDDGGQTWHTSAPLVGAGNIQPSVVQRRDGTLYTLMRDNGPPPKRLLQAESQDRGETWSAVTDSDRPNPGTGAELLRLRDGAWLLINNNTERGRHRLVVELSDDEGRTWKGRRSLEEDPAGPAAGAYHYPSILEARDGSLHATYSFHRHRSQVAASGETAPATKSIKHARFNRAWILQGDAEQASAP